jgi:hypothetical protein
MHFVKRLFLLVALLPVLALAQSYPSPTFQNVTVLGTLSAPAPTFTTPVTVPSGGTGVATLTAHGPLLGQGTSAVTAVAPGTSGLPLLSGGASADPTYSALGLTALATQAANTVLANVTGSPASPTAVTITGCNGAAQALQYTNASGFGCNSTIATSGANANITSLTGLTTPISVGQGGTGATTSTGSGAVVLGTSPTIATPTISSPVITGTATVGAASFYPTVGTNAALQALSTVTTSTVTRLGFYSVGDAPPLVYTASGSACSLNAGNGDNGSQVKSADSKCWIANLGFGEADVREWGAKHDNVNDDTSAIQAASNFLIASGGGVIYVPQGAYKTTSTITLGAHVSIRGDGELVSTFYPTTAVTGAVFSYLPGTFTTSNIVISDIGVLGNATTINAFSFQNLTFVTLQRVYMDSFTNSAQVHVKYVNVEDGVIAGCAFMSIHGNGAQLSTNSNNITIRESTFNAAGAAAVGISLDNTTENTVIQGNNFEGASVGNVGVIAGGTINTYIVANYFEYWTGACITANSGSAYNLRISDNFMLATSAATADAVLNSTNDRMTLENNYLVGLGNASITTIGFYVDGSTNVWARGNKSGGSSTAIVHIGGASQSAPDYTPVVQVAQSLAFLATLPIDANKGSAIFVGALTGNITIGAPSNGVIGQTLTINFLQDGTGGRTVTWNAVFVRNSWSDSGNAANTRSSISFMCLDGTNWVEIAQKNWS